MKHIASRLSLSDYLVARRGLGHLRINLIISASLLSISLFGLSSSAQAEDVKFTQAKVRFNSYKQQLTRLQTAPQSRYLVGELTSLNQWVSQAERELAEDEEERFAMLVDLVQLQIQLIDVSIEELIARERIQVVEAEAQELEALAKREREAISSLEKEMGGGRSAPQKRAQPNPSATPTQSSPPPPPPPSSPTVPTMPTMPQGGR